MDLTTPTGLGSVGWKLAATGFFVFLNGFFVAAEFALVKVRPSQIEARYLTHVGLPGEAPRIAPARAPPQAEGLDNT